MKLRSFILLFLALFLLEGCAGGSYYKAGFGQSPLDQAISERMRSAKLYKNFGTILIVDAFMTDEALIDTWAVEYGRSNRLEGKELEEARAKQRKKLAGIKQFVIALYTSERDWNDLDKFNSRWAVSLKTSEGSFRATSVEKIDSEKLLFRDNIPFDHRFRKFYLASFPEYQAGSAPWRLSISGLLGSVELVWEK